MPSKFRQIQLRLPVLRSQFGKKADAVTKAVMSNPEVLKLLAEERCPICKELFKDCEYMRSLDDD